MSLDQINTATPVHLVTLPVVTESVGTKYLNNDLYNQIQRMQVKTETHIVTKAFIHESENSSYDHDDQYGASGEENTFLQMFDSSNVISMMTAAILIALS